MKFKLTREIEYAIPKMPNFIRLAACPEAEGNEPGVLDVGELNVDDVDVICVAWVSSFRRHVEHRRGQFARQGKAQKRQP